MLIYDVTKRIPSWCDRIFFKKYSETLPLSYNKCLFTISDHQPLYGLYRVKTEIIDEEKRQNILDQIIKENNKENKKKNIDNNFDCYDNKGINTNDVMNANFFNA